MRICSRFRVCRCPVGDHSSQGLSEVRGRGHPEGVPRGGPQQDAEVSAQVLSWSEVVSGYSDFSAWDSAS
jgi:hypothetical protein